MINDDYSVAGLCDTHMHVYGPTDEFPCDGLEPGATFDDYVRLRSRLGIERTVYVQPSAYGRDHACLLDALARDGTNARAVAVAGLEATVGDLRTLDDAGVRGVRFHDLVDGCLTLDELEPVAAHVAPLGWHVIVQCAGVKLAALAERLAALPCDVVIDHIGRIPAEGGTDAPAFQTLLRLLDTGRCWLKLSAPYEVTDGVPAYPDLQDRITALVRTAPERLIWGSNWPHPSIAAGAKPDDARMLRVLAGWCGAAWPAVAAANAARLYGFATPSEEISRTGHSQPESS